jgi:CheY-like chemotaxis protein
MKIIKEKNRILIIDDDADTLETMADILQEKGYITETAKTGKEALSKAENSFFNIALIDIGLPDMTGVEVLQILGEMSPYTMKVMVTGSATLKNAIESVNQGASAYVVKPIDHETLGKIMEECLKKQQMLIFPNEVPASLRKPEIRVLLQAIIDEKITEFKPSMDNEKGVFYPEVEKIIPDPAVYNQVFEILEKYGILKRKFYDSVITCPACGSIKISVKFSCSSCQSRSINKQSEKIFKCNACGKETSLPERIYICGECTKTFAENHIKTEETFTFVVSKVHELLIKKWIDDLDNILTSAREFYREALPRYDSKRPKVSYSAMAKKGESIRYAEQKEQG